MGREVVEHRLGDAIAGEAVGDDADAVAAGDLAAHQIGDMPEQAADRGAQDVNDVERAHECFLNKSRRVEQARQFVSPMTEDVFKLMQKFQSADGANVFQL